MAQTQHKLVVDTREGAVAEALRATGQPFEQRDLPYGDFWVEREGGEVWVWERKTADDLRASIKDGRFREQRERMISHASAGRRGYLLEGGFGGEKRLWGAHWNLLFRDGFVVVRTGSVRETAEALQHFVRKCEDGRAFGAAPREEVDNAAHTGALALAARRGGNLSPARVYTLQWSLIPGVSPAMAERITEALPNWAAVQAMGREGTERLLAEMPAGASGRRFGPKRAATVGEYLARSVFG